MTPCISPEGKNMVSTLSFGRSNGSKEVTKELNANMGLTSPGTIGPFAMGGSMDFGVKEGDFTMLDTSSHANYTSGGNKGIGLVSWKKRARQMAPEAASKIHDHKRGRKSDGGEQAGPLKKGCKQTTPMGNDIGSGLRL